MTAEFSLCCGRARLPEQEPPRPRRPPPRRGGAALSVCAWSGCTLRLGEPDVPPAVRERGLLGSGNAQCVHVRWWLWLLRFPPREPGKASGALLRQGGDRAQSGACVGGGIAGKRAGGGERRSRAPAGTCGCSSVGDGEVAPRARSGELREGPLGEAVRGSSAPSPPVPGRRRGAGPAGRGWRPMPSAPCKCGSHVGGFYIH